MSSFSTACGAVGDLDRWVGDPVDVVTGAQTDRALDFRLRGAFDVLFYRHYDSRRCAEDGGLGPGFRHGFDHRLHFDVDGIRYEAPDGTEASFGFVTQAGWRQAAIGFYLTLEADGRYALTASDATATLYFQMNREGIGRLDAIVQGEHWIRLVHGHARMAGFDSSTGYAVSFEWNETRLVGATWRNPSDGKPRALIQYQYDQLGRLSAGIDAYGHTFAFAFDAANRVVRRTDRNGYAFEFSYDSAGRCVRSRGQDGVLDVALSYDAPARLTTVRRGDGGEWLYFYDDQGTLLQVIDPYGGTTIYSKDPNTGRLNAKIDPAGSATSYLYDETGKLAALAAPDGRTYAPGTDPPGPDHRVAGNAIEWELGVEAPRKFTLPTPSDPLRVPDPEVRASLHFAQAPGVSGFQPVSDAYGTLLREERADGANRRFAYDANGNLRTYVDADGRVYRREFSSWNHLVRSASPLGHVTSYAYNGSEKRTTVVDPGGTRSDYVYDKKDRLIEVRRHGKLRERYVYDTADRIIEKQGSDGQPLLQWSYGAGPIATGLVFASGESQRFSYDATGKVIAAEGAAGKLRFAYDLAGRRTRDLRDDRGIERRNGSFETTVLGRFVTRLRRVDATRSVLVDPTGQVHRLEWDAYGVHTRELAHGITEITQFHPEGMPLTKVLELQSRQALRIRRYSYDGEGNLTRQIDTDRGLSRYEYDGAGRLATEHRADGRVEPYEYDEAGNLLRMPGLSEGETLIGGQRVPGSSQIARGAGNRIYRANGQLFHYDAQDHVAMLVVATGESARYRYDSFDQLVALAAPGVEFTAQYDVLGRRTEKTVNGQRWQYYWDTDRLAAECFPDGKVRVYVYGGNQALVPLMFVDYTSIDAPLDSGQLYYVFTNHLGCTEQVTDTRGTAVWSARISPYGAAEIEIGHDFHQPLRWPGHFHDAETGLHYNRFRYYDPSLGRYLQSDPAGIDGGTNLYAYTTNPLREVDVRGLGCPGGTSKKGEAEGRPKQEGAGGGGTARGVSKPTVTNPKLGNLVNDLYKGARTKNPIGTGSTADAIRHEAATGQAVGGKFHTQKGQEYAKALENWLGKNPGASPADRWAAQSILDDLLKALGSK
jgi:RHS repeat-associated protein